MPRDADREDLVAFQGDFPQLSGVESREINAEMLPKTPKMRVSHLRNTLQMNIRGKQSQQTTEQKSEGEYAVF